MAFVQLNPILTTEALLGLENFYHTKEALSSPLIKYRDSQQNFSSWKYNLSMYSNSGDSSRFQAMKAKMDDKTGRTYS